ncbi:MAG: DUF4258 domain-containing protein [Candidatus Omnitrophica bacterium]|nr:DUF4258 domain-containing protein [Candidatus Omnitrophota bacterium]
MAKRQTKDLLFDVLTPLGFRVYVSRSYWNIIVSVKHPVMSGHEKEVQRTLQSPDEIRRSRKDAAIYLFYRVQGKGRWTCAVSKKANGEGFLVTAYPTDSIKVGEKVWPK